MDVRIDKWLWAARFYKTRSLATNAVEGGRVHVNTQRVKASYRVKINDHVRVSKSSIKQDIIVLGLSDQRRSASEAQSLYKETEDSIAEREMNAMQRKIMNQGMPQSHKKPNKHERRKIRQITGKG